MAFFNGREMKREELLKRVGNIGQIASVKPCELREGRADGLKTFDIITGGGLELTVLEGRCLDIACMRYRGTNLSFLAKPGLTAPQFFSPLDGEFARTFQAGMLYTCGLSNVGAKCSVDGVDYCTHGRISGIPADKVSVSCRWEADQYIMQLSGEMREAALFGENIVLHRTITTRLGAKSITIHDEVENQGFEEQALMLLYHINAGYPLVDDASRLLLPDTKTAPRDEEALKGMDSSNVFTNPIDGYREQVFYHEMACGADGKTCAALVNSGLELGLYVRYNTRQLPRLVHWKSMKTGDYVVGIEPANCLVGGRASEKEQGVLHYLKPFEKAEFTLELGVLDGEKEIKLFQEEINRIIK